MGEVERSRLWPHPVEPDDLVGSLQQQATAPGPLAMALVAA
jgi:hypothetical protein